MNINPINKSKPWSPQPMKTGPVQRKRSSAYAVGNAHKRDYDPLRGDSAPKSFFDKVAETRSAIYDMSNYMLTTNGAVAYSTSGSKLVDINFAVTGLRGKGDNQISTMFRKAWAENPMLAMRWLFYVRDIRGGSGERNIFRVCLADLAKNGRDDIVNAVIKYIPEYGRWDDMWPLLNVPSVKKEVLSVMATQLKSDIQNFHDNKPISLLGKWLPSLNTSSDTTRHYGEIIRKYLKWTPKQYRQTLSALRERIDVIERKMSSQNWQAIDYEKVPSKANLIYNSAFLRHDEERRRAYLDALEKGEAKINSSVAFPHEIVHKYCSCDFWGARIKSYDSALEAMWSSLPNIGVDNTIVVADGSGSMTSTVPGTSISCLEVANALAIYCAERCSGEFKNKYITFSETPRLVDLNGHNLKKNLEIALSHSEVANTNIDAVFGLILTTAKKYNMSQEDLPKQILIISDMQFDSATYCYMSKNARNARPTMTLFQNIQKNYELAGYEMPKLVFWNLNTRVGAIPVSQHENFPCALVSGFSVNILKMVMSQKANPYDILVETLMDKRYNPIEEAYKSVFHTN